MGAQLKSETAQAPREIRAIKKGVFPPSRPVEMMMMREIFSKSYGDFMKLLCDQKHLFVILKGKKIILREKRFSPAMDPGDVPNLTHKRQV